ncbi:MAG: mechanosensitive ion channel family protein [Planctomycetes bacterium]|nr:mechanosensitive ion channel family protein [Planctomycetota bacterium]
MLDYLLTQAHALWAWLTGPTATGVLRALVTVAVGLPLVALVARRAGGWFRRRQSAQNAMLAEKAAYYGGLAVLTVMVVQELGFSLTPLLGAAGVAGVALGFAAQTSVSNLISGLFLIAEKPFQVGDVVTMGGRTGTVLSIDLLSVKLRLLDNAYVRIPNEVIIKNEMANVTRFPIRRVDLNIGVAYKEDIRRVRGLLLDMAWKHPLCLMEPEPQVNMVGFGDSSMDLLFAVWTATPDYLGLRNAMLEEVKRRFDEEGIEIPYPHVSICRGPGTEPFPVQVVSPPHG